MFRHVMPMAVAPILAAVLSLTAAAQEYSNGGPRARDRGPAILTPVEAFGVHPSGPDPADANRCLFPHWQKTFRPYYAPESPTASSGRWRPWCYFPLLPYYTYYYQGYCPHRLCTPEPPPYGTDGWGPGPPPGADPGTPADDYAGYTSVVADDTTFWNMGGNGLVPYGTPGGQHTGPDLVDVIRLSRSQATLQPCRKAGRGSR